MTARRQVLVGLALSVGLGSTAWVLGVTLRGSMLIGLMVAGLVPILLFPIEDPKTLPPPPPRMRHGARVDVSRLSWAMTRRRGLADIRIIRRLRATAHRRLSDLRLDLEQPEDSRNAERLLGSWAYGVVVGTRTEITRSEIVHLVEAVERLGAHRQRAVNHQQRSSERTEPVRRSKL